MVRAKQEANTSVYQVKVTLGDVRPPIWRRILVPADASLSQFHKILQAVMGWEDNHLYVFEVGDLNYGEPSPDWDVKNARRTNLKQVIPGAGFVFYYQYDMGDNWIHKLSVEKVLSSEPGSRYPICLAGKRACPPEDCGGPPGYEELLKAIQNPRHERHQELLKWLGEVFDPEMFSVEVVNAGLRAISFELRYRGS